MKSKKKRVRTVYAWAFVGSHGGIFQFEMGTIAEKYPLLMHIHSKKVSPDLVRVKITQA